MRGDDDRFDVEAAEPDPVALERERCLDVVRRVLAGPAIPHSLPAALADIECEILGGAGADVRRGETARPDA